MFCPKCGTSCENDPLFCPNCGSVLPTEPVRFGEPKKGSHWPPVIIMTAMVVIGLVCFFLFPSKSPAGPSQTPSVNGWYAYSSGTISDFYPSLYTGGTSLTVPGTISGQPVVRIGENSFSDCDTLEEVILPQGLIEIDDSAFEGCDSLRGIYIPDSVIRIGDSAFADCTALEAIYINPSIQTIEASAFTGCDSLHYILFGGTVAQWEALFQGEAAVFTYVYCTDGIYRQGPAQP